MNTREAWPALMSSQTAADFYDISLRQFQRLQKEKELPPPVPLGQQPRWRREDLEAYASKLRPAK